MKASKVVDITFGEIFQFGYLVISFLFVSLGAILAELFMLFRTGIVMIVGFIIFKIIYFGLEPKGV
ncbi:MAG: hypothetical protein WC867_00915 [Candidatus Pacearchaeota archaeon]|jgi:hypothetical protein